MPIQTYVTTYDENLLRDIIKRELARDGQIYFVYNYIDNIYNMASLIQKLIPNIKIGVIHGRLEKADIDDVMNSFYNHEIDLLCSTSIIENGIDVKNANLIIIYDADHFGLSQLYQIKGRVGRGDRLAYAYLMIRNNKEITDDAKKRLKSIQDFTELGSGYKISQRDLEIITKNGIYTSEMIEAMKNNKSLNDAVYVASLYGKTVYKKIVDKNDNEILVDDNYLVVFPEFKKVKGI